MSTYVYLECRDHNPPLTSDDEVGQHLYDLPDIRKAIENRPLMVANQQAGLDIDYGTYFARNAARFLCRHPNCTIAIRDEYGVEHPIEGDER